MNTNIVISLINNTALLLALSIVYQISYLIPAKWNKSIPFIDGCIIGIIGLAIMIVPFQLATGIVFDTRSILIGVSALIFGTIPTVIAALFTIIYRIIMGGAGTGTGVAVIVASAVIGLIWKKYILNLFGDRRWLNIYLFGITIHLVMLACMFMPYQTAISVVEVISMPVLIIYPVGTV